MNSSKTGLIPGCLVVFETSLYSSYFKRLFARIYLHEYDQANVSLASFIYITGR